VPLAAAAGLLVGAAGIFLASGQWLGSTGRGNSDSKATADLKADADRLRLLNQELKDDLDKAILARAQARQLAMDETNKAGELTKEVERLKKDGGTAQKDLQKQFEKLQEDLKAKEKEFTEANDTLTAVKKDRSRLITVVKDLSESQGRLEMTEKRLAAATEEMGRVRKMYDEAEASKQKTQLEFSALTIQRAAMLLDVQRVYLGEGGAESLRTRQEVARSNKLLQRCAELRKGAEAEPARKLLDRLEAVLLRLDMLEPGELSASASFATLVREGDVIEQIDKALASGTTGTKMRSWLLEVRCVLAGADRVG
jgi:chromosome segregation ATPase